MNKYANIYFVEDHPLVRRLLYELINRLPGLRIGEMAATAEITLHQLPNLMVDLALVDISLPGMNDIELVRVLQTQRPALDCLMYSSQQETSYVRRALAAGARGYIIKGNPLELAPAIRQVLDGKRYLSESLQSQQGDYHCALR